MYRHWHIHHIDLPYTSFLASICALILIFLTVNVVILRGKHKIAIGEIKHDSFKRRNGALTNFANNTPMVLILMAMAEIKGLNCGVLFFITGTYIVGRLAHIHSLYSFENKHKTFRLRVLGMAITFLTLGFLALANLYLQFVSL